MSKNIPKNFLGLEKEYCDYKKAKVAIISAPYEGTVSYMSGTGRGPQAIIHSSAYVELYDEELKKNTYELGIATLPAIKPKKSSKDFSEQVKVATANCVRDGKFPIVLGGEHSLSLGTYLGLKEKYKDLSVVQFDAHTDLREEYEGSKWSHACVMKRIRDTCPHVVPIGIRSLCDEEALLIEKNNYPVYFAHQIVNQMHWVPSIMDHLTKNVFITIDVDCFSWDVVSDTGTPEPGGLGWYQMLDILKFIFRNTNVVGFDVVELSENKQDPKSAFAMAKLIYRLIGYKYYLK